MWYYLSGDQFIVPNPIASMRILLNDIARDKGEGIYFNFVLSKDTMKRPRWHMVIQLEASFM